MPDDENPPPGSIRVLFVCLGNICRSPLAEGIFRHMALETAGGRKFFADSAGIGGWHRGEPPDRRAIWAARRRGIDISTQRSRQIASADFRRFDCILAMDAANVRALQAIAGAPAEIHRLLDFAGVNGDIADPYAGGEAEFDRVCHEFTDIMPRVIARLSGSNRHERTGGSG